MNCCPFCGETKVKVVMDNVYAFPSWFVHCTNCSINGPSSEVSEDEAIVKWNKRHTSSRNYPINDLNANHDEK